MAVRNEERWLGDVLDALERQTLPLSRVVVVDDGSIDNTPRIIAHYRAEPRFNLKVVTLPYHPKSKVSTPELARVWNAGIALLRDPPIPAYVMILGGDTLLPPTYVEQIIAKMEQNPNFAVASGWIVGEPYDADAPYGSSRVIRTLFWTEANGMQFHVSYGWEDWVHLKALQMGYQSCCFREIHSYVLRKTGNSNGVSYGRAMYVEGYHWLYAVGASLVRSHYSPKTAGQILSGYVRPGRIPKLDVSDWVGNTQKKSIPKKVSQVLRNPLRR